MTPGAKKERPGRGMKLPGRAQATDERTVDDQDTIPDSNQKGRPVNARKLPPLDHESALVTETPDNPVVRQHDLEPVRVELVKHRIGLAILGVMIASPKLGGPSAQQVATAIVNTIGTAGSIALGAVASLAGLLVAIRNHF